MTSRTPVLGQYLRSRRARMDPRSFGFPDDGRRVPGLRREEIAQLAGISRDYYTRLEQGQGHQMSDQVMNSLAEALQLDGDERTYLRRIARSGLDRATRSVEPLTVPVPVSDQVLTLLKSWSHVPAYLFDSNLDIVAINEMGDYLSPLYAAYGDNSVLASFGILRDYPHFAGYLDVARSTVAALRFHGDPSNPRYRELVGELSVEHPLFRRMWSEHDARPLSDGSAWISIDGSEPVEVPWQVLEVPGGFFLSFRPVREGSRAHELFEQVRLTKMTGRGIRGPLAGWPAT
ncbi:helix-turn-helix transcriptional regulator [Herbiconiux daphne]|uniref:Helix-turn-helix transcriptional regulator n=1 Tax=Herbiconiux daphne TaxID=2970914 RepID=A0ABT2GZP0_9MICO|nr:helix-turn-helix transcriptional regulator [Herbiconiux daphne]MCS5732777.1 helix-turn-helix transcriptional regulator [Herbiconiux daphne]